MLNYYEFNKRGVLPKQINFVCYVCGCDFSTPRKDCTCDYEDGRVSWKFDCPDCNAQLSTKPDFPENIRNANNTIANMLIGDDDGK